KDSSALLNIQDHLRELYRMLVHPVEALVENCESLAFVPFDFLHYLPFHALFDGSKYLIDRFNISYAPTANIFRLFATKQIRSNGPALLIGVPDSGTPFIPDEIENIRSVMPNAR